MKKASWKTKKTIGIFVCILLLVIAFIVGLMIGSYSMTPLEVIETLFCNGNKMQNFTIFQIRLPRICLAIVVASGLGVSGGILQGITRNPLAEPGMIGINAGSALAVVLFISASCAVFRPHCSPIRRSATGSQLFCYSA